MNFYPGEGRIRLSAGEKLLQSSPDLVHFGRAVNGRGGAGGKKWTGF